MSAAESGREVLAAQESSQQLAAGSSTARTRDLLRALPPYRAGRSPKPNPTDAGLLAPVYKLSSNENPFPPLPSVLEAVAAASERINRYPDFASTELTEALAAHCRVDPSCIAVGTGSVGVLQSLLAIVAGAGDEVIYAWRSFEAYPIVTTLAGATPIPVPLTGADSTPAPATGAARASVLLTPRDAPAPSQGSDVVGHGSDRHDLPAMADAVTSRTRLILICSPNNPTGTVVHEVELRVFLDRIPQEVLVVLDEAYVEFVRDPQAPDGLSFVREYPNVALLRTFSKAYGLAGLRVGYAVARPEIVDALRRAALPFGVNLLAQAAAVASLGAQFELADRVDSIVRERGRVLRELRSQGWQVPQAEGNFFWLGVGGQSAELTDRCEEGGVLVRRYADDGVRVTLGEPAANNRLLQITGGFSGSVTKGSYVTPLRLP